MVYIDINDIQLSDPCNIYQNLSICMYDLLNDLYNILDENSTLANSESKMKCTFLGFQKQRYQFLSLTVFFKFLDRKLPNGL